MPPPVPGAAIGPEHHQHNPAETCRAWHENVEPEPTFAPFVERLNQQIGKGWWHG